MKNFSHSLLNKKVKQYCEIILNFFTDFLINPGATVIVGLVILVAIKGPENG